MSDERKATRKEVREARKRLAQADRDRAGAPSPSEPPPPSYRRFRVVVRRRVVLETVLEVWAPSDLEAADTAVELSRLGYEPGTDRPLDWQTAEDEHELEDVEDVEEVGS